jgi:hypothetical protein
MDVKYIWVKIFFFKYCPEKGLIDLGMNV